PPQDYLALWKLEVLPDYRGKDYGKALVDYAKSYQLPIKTNPLINSHGFWEKLDFQKAQYDMERDLGENPLIWLPSGVKEKETEYTCTDFCVALRTSVFEKYRGFSRTWALLIEVFYCQRCTGKSKGHE